MGADDKSATGGFNDIFGSHRQIVNAQNALRVHEWVMEQAKRSAGIARNGCDGWACSISIEPKIWPYPPRQERDARALERWLGPVRARQKNKIDRFLLDLYRWR
jgi:hypothetical protein